MLVMLAVSSFLAGCLAVSSFQAWRFSYRASAVSASTLNTQVSAWDAGEDDNTVGLQELYAAFQLLQDDP